MSVLGKALGQCNSFQANMQVSNLGCGCGKALKQVPAVHVEVSYVAYFVVSASAF